MQLIDDLMNAESLLGAYYEKLDEVKSDQIDTDLHDLNKVQLDLDGFKHSQLKELHARTFKLTKDQHLGKEYHDRVVS